MKKTAYLTVLLIALGLGGCGGNGGGGGDGTEQTGNLNQFDCDRLVDFDPSKPEHENICKKDADKDGILDDMDNCPAAYNVNQTDTDSDLMGDACDPDTDDDGLENSVDNCPLVANSDQANLDGDEFGDACDGDKDNDNYDDEIDNCPLFANTEQADLDGDGIGDACDPDLDNDGFENVADNCPVNENPDQSDIDGDGIGDVCDTANVVRKCTKLFNTEFCYDVPVYPPAPAEVCPLDKARIAVDLGYVDATQVTQDDIDGYPQYHLPPRSGVSLGKVSQRQMVARIMAGAAFLIDTNDALIKDCVPTPEDNCIEKGLNSLIRDAFNAARQANKLTETWNNCDMQASWEGFQSSSAKEFYDTARATAPRRIYHNGKRIIVAFQGTQSKDDIINDITVSREASNGINYHSGVLKHYRGHRNSVINKIREVGLSSDRRYVIKKVYFTGHSLGGATANMALYDYVKEFGTSSREFPQTFTFGASPIADKGNYCVSTGTILPPWWNCVDNPDKFDLTTAYGERTNTHVKNLIHNFANFHAEILKNDPVPHLFRTYSHVGYHNILGKRGGSSNPATEHVDSRWRIRSNHDEPNHFNVDVAKGLGGAAQKASDGVLSHNLCYYARNLEFSVDDSYSRWMSDDKLSPAYRASAMANIGEENEKCVYPD